MNKILKVFLEVVLLLSIFALVIVFLVFSARSEIVPDIYVTSDRGKVAMAVRGGYTWNSFYDSVVADAIAPEQYVYKTENTLLVMPGEKMIFKNSERSIDCHKFYQLEMKYYDDSNIEYIVPNQEDSKNYADLKYLELAAPLDEGTYIYNFTFSYYNKGKVDYGLKVVVSTEPSYEIDELIKFNNTQLVDTENINNIIENLPYSKGKNSIIIKNNFNRKELLINYDELVVERKELTNNVIALFTLIPELELITYQSKDVIYTFTQEEIEYSLGRTLEDYASNIELWKKEILYKEKTIDKNILKDTIFKSIITDILSEYEEKKVSSVVINTNSLKNTSQLSLSNVDVNEVLMFITEYTNVVLDMNFEDFKKTNRDGLYIEITSVKDKLKFIEGQFSGDSYSENINLEDDMSKYFSGDEFKLLQNQYVCTIKTYHEGTEDIFNYEIEYKNEKWNITEI